MELPDGDDERHHRGPQFLIDTTHTGGIFIWPPVDTLSCPRTLEEVWCGLLTESVVRVHDHRVPLIRRQATGDLLVAHRVALVVHIHLR